MRSEIQFESPQIQRPLKIQGPEKAEYKPRNKLRPGPQKVHINFGKRRYDTRWKSESKRPFQSVADLGFARIARPPDGTCDLWVKKRRNWEHKPLKKENFPDLLPRRRSSAASSCIFLRVNEWLFRYFTCTFCETSATFSGVSTKSSLFKGLWINSGGVQRKLNGR